MNHVVIIILLVFFPGIIGTLLFQKLQVQKPLKGDEKFRFIITTFLFGIIAYSILSLFICKINILDLMINPEKSNMQPKTIIFSTIISIILAIVWTFIDNQKVIIRIAQKFNLTTKYGDESLYEFYLNSEKLNWVYIRNYENNLIFFGAVKAFNDEKDKEIVLENVIVYLDENDKGIIELYKLNSLYLKLSEKMIIEEPMEE